MAGVPAVVALIDGADWIGVPAVVLGELRTGIVLATRAQRNEEELQRFLDHPAVSVIDVDDQVSRVYAELVTDLRRAGTPVPTNDVWVAAAAWHAGCAVLTYDAHFKRMTRVAAIIPPHRP